MQILLNLIEVFIYYGIEIAASKTSDVVTKITINGDALEQFSLLSYIY
jgi:hypothetical protein